MLKLAARLEWKSFFAVLKVLFSVKSSCKKDWGRKAEIAAQIDLMFVRILNF
jgi:hypothetical protein